MKWLLSDLAIDDNKKMAYERKIQPDINDFKSIKRLRSIDSFIINGIWYYDEVSDLLYTEFNLSGTVVVADSLTLEDIELKIDANSTEVFTFGQIEEDGIADYLIEGNQIDLKPIVNQIIVANIPLKTTSIDKEYPHGENWEIISEEDFNKEPKGINPKMAKLLEYDIEDE